MSANGATLDQATSGPALLRQAAEDYLAADLCVLNALRRQKRPARSWKAYQEQRPTAAEVAQWFAGSVDALCLVCGRVSGNLEMIDFDNGGELFEAWRANVCATMPALFERLVVERSQSGGRHVVYRCAQPVSGNAKLAQRLHDCTGPEQVEIGGKRYKPHRIGTRWCVPLTLIETRGEGGLFLCAPTEGYELLQGDLAALPVITEDERDCLISAACQLNEHVETVNGPSGGSGISGTRPGDDFNASGDIRPVLERHGWRLFLAGENEQWCRPGKESGCSATLKQGVLYVFSTNAAPFEAGKGYPAFAVYALLEHAGDYRAAAKALRAEGYGDDRSCRVAAPPDERPPKAAHPSDPGPLPVQLLRVPGFIGQVMDHTLATAPYPNPVMAFCGALALQAFLAGRRVRDESDNRTNVYVLALAYSSAGKDQPRKVNTSILHHLGLIDCLGGQFASGEGIQDALLLHPSMLFQTDEIDGMLQSINRSQDARHENIMSTLLTAYSSANSIMPMRRKAGRVTPDAIDQPNLVLLGTAIPTHYYAALSARMLTNGFFGRMLLFESGPRSLGKESRPIDPLPESILSIAKQWIEPQPRSGNLSAVHPVPTVVEATSEARDALARVRSAADAEYGTAEANADPVATTVWGRVTEHVRKLALLYAISEAKSPSAQIQALAVEWAQQLVFHQARRMLFMAANHVAENAFDADCQKMLHKLRDEPSRHLPRSTLLKRMKVQARHFNEVVETLIERGDVSVLETTTAGRNGTVYQLRAG